MIDKVERDKIRAIHQVGFRGMFGIYSMNKFKRGSLFPSIVTIIFVIIFPSLVENNLSSHLYLLIINITNLIISIIPNLIGFLLGGYAIIIGFGNIEFLKKTAYIDFETDKLKPSYYQDFSALFSFALIFHSAFLILCFIINLIAHSQLKTDIVWLTLVINSVVAVTLIFSSFYALNIVIDMVKNVFNLSQSFHHSLVLEDFVSYKQSKKQEDSKEVKAKAKIYIEVAEEEINNAWKRLPLWKRIMKAINKENL